MLTDQCCDRAYRGEQIVFAALLREYRHALQQTSEDLGRLLEKVRADQSSFDDYQAAVVREAGRQAAPRNAVSMLYSPAGVRVEAFKSNQ